MRPRDAGVPGPGRPRDCSYNPAALPAPDESAVLAHVMANRTNSITASHAATADTGRHDSRGRWGEDDEGAGWPAFKALTREEASALRAKEPPLGPWRVLAVQGGVGVVVALLAALITGRVEVGWSALYGAACVVVPGALLARGMTSRLSSMTPGASAVSFMLWEMVKIAVSIAMLMLAPKLVQGLSWPALLAGLVLCMKVYWFALLWRGRVSRTTA